MDNQSTLDVGCSTICDTIIIVIQCKMPYNGGSQLGVLEPQGVREKFQGVVFIAQGYANYGIEGTQITKIIA